MNIIQRVKTPTPIFFAKLRNISLALAVIGGAILTAPVAMPAIVLKVAGYLAVAGSTGAAVSQVVVPNEDMNKNGRQDGD